MTSPRLAPVEKSYHTTAGMARTDWVALLTDPAAEYSAATELERLGLNPYLPQIRKRWQPPKA